MIILVNDIEKTKINERICPIGKESIKIRIKDYKINFYECKNGHNKNIVLDFYAKKCFRLY